MAPARAGATQPHADLFSAFICPALSTALEGRGPASQSPSPASHIGAALLTQGADSSALPSRLQHQQPWELDRSANTRDSPLVSGVQASLCPSGTLMLPQTGEARAAAERLAGWELEEGWRE